MKNPSWEIKRWDDEDCRALVKEHYPKYLSLYDGFERNVQRADMFRYLLLHKYGGIYTDMDSECLKPVDKLIDNDIIFSIEPIRNNKLYKIDLVVSNCFMYSKPGNPFWEHLIETILISDMITGNGEVMEKTGPLMLTDAYLTYKEKGKVKLLENEDVVWWDKEELAYVVHYNTTVWLETNKYYEIINLEAL